MEEELKLEISTIEKIIFIKDKLMVIMMYMDIYNAIYAQLVNLSVEEQKKYIVEIKDALHKTIFYYLLKEYKSIDASKVIIKFLKTLEKMDISNISEIRDIIKCYEKEDYLNECMKGKIYVPVIDKSEIEFSKKADLAIIFSNHLTNINARFRSYYNGANDKVMNDLYIYLVKSLPNILIENVDYSRFKVLLKKNSRDFLENLVDAEEFKPYDSNIFQIDLINSSVLTDRNLNMLIDSILDNLSGYEKYDMGYKKMVLDRAKKYSLPIIIYKFMSKRIINKYVNHKNRSVVHA